MSKFCGNCGNQAADNANVCGYCGNAFPDSQQSVNANAYTQPQQAFESFD